MMNRQKLISLLTGWIFFAIAVLPAEPAYAASALPISAPSVVLLDQSTQKIIFAKTPHHRHAPASTTKILTALVVIEHLPLARVVKIPSMVEGIEPSKVYLKPGERYRVRDLVRAMLISSANDAAEVLAVAAAGSRARFADMMNRKAREIGARRSHFVRPSGLPARGQYSTAYDLMLIMKETEKYPFLVHTLETKTRVVRSLAGRRIYLKNHNKMLWKQNRDVIGKTGWTRKARHCFVGQVRVMGKRAVVAIMGSHRLWRDLKTLIDYQFGLMFSRIRTNKKLWSEAQTRGIQAALKRAGFDPGPADGAFGPRTVRAVEQFQKAHRLSVDGIVGKKTRHKLRRYGGP